MNAQTLPANNPFGIEPRNARTGHHADCLCSLCTRDKRPQRPDARASVLRKAHNLRNAITRARADNNEQLAKIWERDLRVHRDAYLIADEELA